VVCSKAFGRHPIIFGRLRSRLIRCSYNDSQQYNVGESILERQCCSNSFSISISGTSGTISEEVKYFNFSLVRGRRVSDFLLLEMESLQQMMLMVRFNYETP